MDQSFPRISVVIPNYNHGNCLGTALKSVCSQDPPPCELVVFDDCSTDNSVEVVSSFARRHPFVRLVRYPEKSADWLKALFSNFALLAGDYVLGLGADDYIYPGLIRALGQMVVEYPQCGVFFSDFHYVDGNRRVIQEMRSGFDSPRYLEGQELADQLCRIDPFECSVGAIARKDLLLWIIRNDALAMGPWYDSVGYPVMAMKQGACYVPSFLAAYNGVSVPDRAKVSLEFLADSRKSLEVFQNVRGFLRQPEINSTVPAEVLEVLETKAMFDFRFEGRGRILWQRLMDRSQALIASRRFEQANRWLRRVVQIFPGRAEGFFAWGVVLHKLGRLEDEENAFRRATELDPGMAAAHSNWGACRQARGYPAEAIEAYRRSIDVDRGFVAGYSNLGRLLFAEGELYQALEVQQRLVELAPQVSDAYVQLGKTLLALDRAKEAAAACRNAVSLDPEAGEARALLEQAARRLESLRS